MDKYHRDQLRKNHVALIEDMKPEPVVEYLHREGIFTDYMVETIQAQRARLEKNTLLIDWVEKIGPTAFEQFCNALIETGQEYPAALIRPDCYFQTHAETTCHKPVTEQASEKMVYEDVFYKALIASDFSLSAHAQFASHKPVTEQASGKRDDEDDGDKLSEGAELKDQLGISSLDIVGETLPKELPEETSVKGIVIADIYQAACVWGMQNVYKANVIVVGQGSSGKTHLCRNLLGEPFTEGDLVTNGIAVSGCVLDKYTTDTTFNKQDEYFHKYYHINTLASGVKKYEETENTSRSWSAPALIKVEEDDDTKRQVLEKSKRNPDVPKSVTLWDFGGQYVFYTTHQTFLTWRAVYLLVFDMTKELNYHVPVERSGRTPKNIPVDIVPSTTGGFLKFWQNSIHTLTKKIGEDAESEYICPRILLVGTHRDKLGHTEEERKKAVDAKFCEIQDYLRGRQAHDMHVKPYLYAVNNCDPRDAGIQELRDDIGKTINDQPYWGEEQPLKYVLLEKRLKDISKSQKCLSLIEMHEQGKQYGLVNDEMVLHFLKFYSELGELVFFNEDDTRNIVILDPQWLINAFASLITVEKYHKDSNPKAMDYWDLLNDRGELDDRLIDIVWEEESELKENKAVLLCICQRFDLLVGLQKEEANGKWKKYLVPCVLKNHSESVVYLSEDHLKMQKIPPLYLMFDGGFCPPGLFHRLVVCCYREWSSHDQDPYCNFACFKVDDSIHTILELWNEGNGTFRLMVGSLKSDVGPLEDDNAFNVLTYITQELDRLIKAYSPYLKYSIAFRFPHGLVKLTDMVKKTDSLKTVILEKKDVCPPGCPEVIETAPYRKWLRNNENTVCPSPTITDYPHDDLVWELSSDIGNEWEAVAAFLGVKRAQIDHLKHDYSNDMFRQIGNMLFQWRDAMGTTSNEERRDKLKEALTKARRNDLADSLG